MNRRITAAQAITLTQLPGGIPYYRVNEKANTWFAGLGIHRLVMSNAGLTISTTNGPLHLPRHTIGWFQLDPDDNILIMSPTNQPVIKLSLSYRDKAVRYALDHIRNQSSS